MFEDMQCRGVMIKAGYWKAWYERTLTTEMIQKEPNSEVRRILITMYGTEQFLRDCSAEICPDIVVDKDNARVLELDFSGDKVFFLELINSTIEPGFKDKSEEERLAAGLTKEGYKRYFQPFHPQQVHKGLRSSDAVGWTFGLGKGEYNPTKES